MLATSPKASLAKLTSLGRPKTFKVLILGHSGVGKTAMAVRFITKRFIGSYDNVDEKLYCYTTLVDNELISFEIIDRPGHFNTIELNCLKPPSTSPTPCPGISKTNIPRGEIKDLETQLKWADAFILVYSVTDKCSFDECNRLKFLINYHKRRRKITNKDCLLDVPVVLVGNKADQCEDRMVTLEDGFRRSKEISCVSFHEISVREDIEDVKTVFVDLTRYWRLLSRSPKLKRSTSDSHEALTSPEMMGSYQMRSIGFSSSTSMASSPNGHSSILSVGNGTGTGAVKPEKRPSMIFFGRLWAESSPDEAEEMDEEGERQQERFRDRASTEGTLLNRSRRWRFTPPPNHSTGCTKPGRRMSMSLRGQ